MEITVDKQNPRRGCIFYLTNSWQSSDLSIMMVDGELQKADTILHSASELFSLGVAATKNPRKFLVSELLMNHYNYI